MKKLEQRLKTKGLNERRFREFRRLDPLLSGDHLIVCVKKILRDIAVFGRHSDQFLIVNRNPKFLCEADADLASAAAEFTADSDDFAHNIFLPCTSCYYP